MDVFAFQVFGHRGLLQEQEGDEDDGGVREHIGGIVESGIEPGGGHGHAKEVFRHILCPNSCAHHIMDKDFLLFAYMYILGDLEIFFLSF